ncbi:MAG TPA: YMGG-like glycine zipper-containing protein [Gemmatimonadaceae bacterium]
MTRYLSALAMAALVAAGACSRNNNKPGDSALNTDLSLAAQQRNSLDSISAVERGNALAASQAPVTRTSAGDVAHTTTATHHTATHRSSSSGSSSSSGGSSTVAAAPVTHTVTEKHTQRDAAIGAGAGAVLGAVTSKNKVKGGIIGGVLGGVLGGVIGNNVDKKKKTVP